MKDLDTKETELEKDLSVLEDISCSDCKADREWLKSVSEEVVRKALRRYNGQLADIL